MSHDRGCFRCFEDGHADCGRKDCPYRNAASGRPAWPHPLLVGMNNPLSRDPQYALYPDPPNCTGWRIWQLLDPAMTPDEYLEAYERTNLVEGLAWSSERARMNASRIRDLMTGRRTVLFGAEVRSAMGWAKRELMVWYGLAGGGQFVLLPHPSGRNLWFNDARNRAAAARILHEALSRP